MGQKSINNIYTVFHALSRGIGGKYSFLQEDGELTRYHHRYIDLPLHCYSRNKPEARLLCGMVFLALRVGPVSGQ